MDGDVEAHELDKGGVLAKAEEGGEVVGVVLLEVDRRELTLAVDVAVDAAGDVGQLCDAGGGTGSVGPFRKKNGRGGAHRSIESSKTGPQ